MKRLIESLEAGVIDDTGAALSYGQVFSYQAGTTELTSLYQDFDLETPHPNPLTLDAAGRVVAYVDGRVKLVIQDEEGTLIRTLDNVGTSDSDIAASSNVGLAGNGLIAAEDGSLDVNVDTTLTISSDRVGIADTSITTARLVDLAVTTAKLAEASVTLEKLATDAVETIKIKDANVTTAKLADNAVTTAKIAALNVTRDKLAALGQQVAASSNFSFNASQSGTAVTPLSVTLTTTGRPVLIGLGPNPLSTTNASGITLVPNSGTGTVFRLGLKRGSTTLSLPTWTTPNSTTLILPVSFIQLDAAVLGAPGSYTYSAVYYSDGFLNAGTLLNVVLFAFEL